MSIFAQRRLRRHPNHPAKQTRDKVTRKQIADAAGVSPAVVSFVMNGQAERLRVSPETTLLRPQHGGQTRYTGNYHARALVSGRSQILGLVVSDEDDVAIIRFWETIVLGMAVTSRNPLK